MKKVFGLLRQTVAGNEILGTNVYTGRSNKAIGADGQERKQPFKHLQQKQSHCNWTSNS